MSKETLAWFGIPIVMGIGFLLFRNAMDLPTEESTNRLVGLVTLAVLVLGSIAAYKVLRTFWQDRSTSRPIPLKPKPESESPTSNPAPVKTQATPIPSPPDNPPMPADMHTEIPASETITPAMKQLKKTAFFQGILLGLLLGVTIGLMFPFFLQFASRNDQLAEEDIRSQEGTSGEIRGIEPFDLKAWFSEGTEDIRSQVDVPSSTPTTVPVTGTVWYKGVPLPEAVVFFIPEANVPADQPRGGFATTDAQGRYSISTFARNDGAIPGRYRATVEAFKWSDELLTPLRYSHRDTTPLTVEVKLGEPLIFDLDLSD